MLVFIDESGIHKQDGQSTTAVVYVKVVNVEGLDRAVLKIEAALKIKPFHWRGQSWEIRQNFLGALIKEDFEVKIFLFSNPFTDQKLENAWKHLLVEKNIENIIIDGKKPRHYTQELKKILRQGGIAVRKIRMGNDKSFPCLRIADLFAGITRSYAESPEKQKVKNLYDLARIKITIHLRGWPGAG